jgi:hypothetical protein
MDTRAKLALKASSSIISEEGQIPEYMIHDELKAEGILTKSYFSSNLLP